MPIQNSTDTQASDWQNYLINLVANQHQFAQQIISIINHAFQNTKQQPDLKWFIEANHQPEIVDTLIEELRQTVGGQTYVWKQMLDRYQMINWVNYLHQNPLDDILIHMVETFIKNPQQWPAITYADYYQAINNSSAKIPPLFKAIDDLEQKFIKLVQSSNQ